jgi:hypothetical protein
VWGWADWLEEIEKTELEFIELLRDYNFNAVVAPRQPGGRSPRAKRSSWKCGGAAFLLQGWARSRKRPGSESVPSDAPIRRMEGAAPARLGPGSVCLPLAAPQAQGATSGVRHRVRHLPHPHAVTHRFRTSFEFFPGRSNHLFVNEIIAGGEISQGAGKAWVTYMDHPPNFAEITRPRDEG